MERTRVYKNFHQWLLPERAVVGILSLAFVFVFVGIVLLAIGSSLTVWGAIFFGLGMCLVLVCLLLCLHACFVMYVRDQETQTSMDGIVPQTEKRDHPDFIPTYAVIDKKPPPSPSSVRNGRAGGGSLKKFVTLGDNVQQQKHGGHERSIAVNYQSQMNHPPPYSGDSSQYSSYGKQTSYDYQQAAQHQQHPYPMYQSQPTPYSTLSQKHPVYPMQVYPIYRSGFDEDYDNPAESAPIMNYQQTSSKWRTHNSVSDDIPEPTPLVHPSEKRPMTFEQVSSSKMSIYDNVQFGLNKLEEE